MSSKGYTPNLKITSLWGGAFVLLAVVLIVIGALGVPGDWRYENGFLGTNASRMSDITLLAYVFILIPLMLVGFFFARKKQFVPHHQVIMTAVVILNWGLIGFIMIASYRQIGDNPNYAQPIIHGLLGFVAQLVGSYLVIRMWFEDSLPAVLKIKQIKLLMRFVLACWLLTAAFGIVTYVSWNLEDSDADSTAPIATPEAVEDEAEPEATPEAAEDEAVEDEAEPEATPEAAEDEAVEDDAEPEATPEATQEAD